ncbi:hypothetical protein V6N13_052718 [Hibiscus sabdariffa]|uniref:GRAM domain-containing protein n=1 Tax=Hibiscus sabdariffa TaxID=183260 RepID=A0ABR2Q5I0_9ROSI
MDPKASDPAMDAEAFVMVPTTEPDKMEENQTLNPKQTSASKRTITEKFTVRVQEVETMDTVKDLLGRWTRKVGEATRKAEDLAGNTWQHLRTNPSFAEAAMGRIAQGTKVLAEGGYEKIFRQTFETVPEEQLLDSFACYLSTSAGPVMGVLYVSTVKLAYCSDSPLSYNNGSRTEWSYYKVIMPLHQLRAVNPSTSRVNPSEKMLCNSIVSCLYEYQFLSGISSNVLVILCHWEAFGKAFSFGSSSIFYRNGKVG